MAHAWRIGISHIGFNFDESEEAMFLAAYIAIRDSAGMAVWQADLRSNYFEQGKGLSERIISGINAELTHSGRLTLILRPRPTAKTPWMHMRGEEKAEARARLLASLEEKGAHARWLAAARTHAAQLPKPREWDEAEQNAMFAEAIPRLLGEGARVRETIVHPAPLTHQEALTRFAAIANDQPDITDLPHEFDADQILHLAPASHGQDCAAGPRLRVDHVTPPLAANDAPPSHPPDPMLAALLRIEANQGRMLQAQQETMEILRSLASVLGDRSVRVAAPHLHEVTSLKASNGSA